MRGRVSASRAGLELEGRPLVASRDVAAGLVRASPASLRLLLRRGGTLDVAARDPETARALMRELGFGPEERAAAIPVNVSSRAVALGTIPFFSALLAADAFRAGQGFGLAICVVALLFNAWWIWKALKLPKLVEVGLDALRLHTPLRSVRTLPLGEVRAVESMQGKVRLDLTNGGVEELQCSADEGDLVAERVREALEAGREDGRPPGEAALARSDRPIATWISELRGLLRRDESGYRRFELDAATLLRIAEDARMPGETRVAAAIALGPELDDDKRKRLRVAADTAAMPKLRVALEAASAGEDEELADALAELETEAEARRHARG